MFTGYARAGNRGCRNGLPSALRRRFCRPPYRRPCPTRLADPSNVRLRDRLREFHHVAGLVEGAIWACAVLVVTDLRAIVRGADRVILDIAAHVALFPGSGSIRSFAGLMSELVPKFQ